MPRFAPKTRLVRSRRLTFSFVAASLAIVASRPAPVAAEHLSGHLGLADLTRLEFAPEPQASPGVLPAEIAATPEPDLQMALDWLPVVLAIPRGHKAIAAHAHVTGTNRSLTAECLGTTGYRGYQIAMLRVERPRETTLPAAGIDVEIETAPGGTPPVACLRDVPDMAQAARARLQALVANPADVDAAAPPSPARTGKSSASAIARGGYRPLGDPSLDGSGVRYLIITSAALAPAFQPLADWKTRRGVPAAIRSIEWIESRTRRGIDRAETIRNFLVEAYALWGVEWVLLGGDTGIIPARFAWSSLYGGGTSPSDLYFSCLDGNWNSDGDAIWGEGAVSIGPGESDIYPELCVARAPVNNMAEAQLFVTRSIAYEAPIFTDYQHKAAFLAEVLVPANWDSGQAVSVNGATGTEQMITQSLPASFQVQKLYDTYWQYPGSTKLTRNATTNAMNTGVGIVNHLGHGYRYTMSCGDISFVNSDADALANGGRQFILVMANCAAVAFDYNCLAERFLLNAGGGAAGVVGASRSVSASLIVTYNRAFHRRVFEYGHVHMADALNEMRLERTAIAELDGSDRWIHFSLNALGDPELTMFTGPVRTSELTHVTALPLAATNLQVGVAASGSPVSGATVCALKGDEVYAVAATDAAGLVQLPIAPETTGPMYVTVSGANLTTRTDTLQVTPPAGAVLVSGGFVLDDDATAPSQGNGNSVADAGETMELSISVTNHGVATADSVVGTVQSSDPRVTVLQGVLTVGAVAAGASQSGQSPVVVQLAPEIPDGSGFDLVMSLAAAGGGQWTDRLHLRVCAPRLEVTRVLVTTPTEATKRQIATTTTLAIEAKNYGSGIQPPFIATWLAFDSTAAVVQDSMQFPALPQLVIANGAPELAIAYPGPPTPMQLRLADTMGRQWTLRVDAQPPTTLAKPLADLSDPAAQVRLKWTVSDAPDHLGYHVFRAASGSGTFTRLTPDIIRFGDYYDTGAVANSHYDYYVVDVDSSYQWSAPSPVLTVNTSSASLPGWPVQMTDPTASSVAVGDLDGDGSPEVVVGDNGVYAWHADGLEVRDGDNNGSTPGVFSMATGIMNASVALASLDAVPGLEIVAASWLTNRIYIWNRNGTLLPGWPREPANGGNPGYWASPAIGDVDGDGQPEIVAISKDGWLYAWHKDGTPLIPATNGGVRLVGAWTQTTPALADLDGDGKREMIVSGSLGRVDVIRWDGTDFPGWPQSLYAFGKVSPLVSDLDNDGDLDIVIGSESDHLYIFESNGTIRPGWPKLVVQSSPDFGPSPALGDLDGDGRLDIVVVSNKSPFTLSKLFVYNVDGDILLEKQLELNSQSSPILADVNGDGAVDIVHGGEGGVLHAWDYAGQELSGFPIALGDWIRGTPEYCDLDRDGFGDLVLAGWDKTVHVWRMTGPYRPDRAPWPMFHGNHQRDGYLPPHFATAIDETPLPRRFAASWSPNPFNPSVRLVLDIPSDAPAAKAAAGAAAQAANIVPVTVSVYDVRGRRVRKLLDAPQAAGTLRLVWDGRDDSGRPLGSGLYFYRVIAGTHTATGKLTLLR